MQEEFERHWKSKPMLKTYVIFRHTFVAPTKKSFKRLAEVDLTCFISIK